MPRLFKSQADPPHPKPTRPTPTLRLGVTHEAVAGNHEWVAEEPMLIRQIGNVFPEFLAYVPDFNAYSIKFR